MIENHYFADVDLPFHVWVRERTGARVRWVLREAPQRPDEEREPSGARETPAGEGPALV